MYDSSSRGVNTNSPSLLPSGMIDEGIALLADPTPWPDTEVNTVLEEIYDDQAISHADACHRRDANSTRDRLRQAMPAGSVIDANRTFGVDELSSGEYDVDRYNLRGYYNGDLIASGMGDSWAAALADALKDMAEKREKAIAKAAAMTAAVAPVSLVA